MDESCDTRITAYKDGRTFQDCREMARSLAPTMADLVKERGALPWDRIMEAAEYDAVVYKLTLKYLRQDGFDIGNHSRQQVTPGTTVSGGQAGTG